MEAMKILGVIPLVLAKARTRSGWQGKANRVNGKSVIGWSERH